jgi:uncharacterized membrane protein YphA (DoxX/SURF4 family)
MAGGTKLAGADMQIALFEQIGLGQWFRYITGRLEVLGALLLLVPTTAAMGAALLAPTMVGAMATHLFLIGGSPVPSLTWRTEGYSHPPSPPCRSYTSRVILPQAG